MESFNTGHNGDHCKIIYVENFRVGRGTTYNDYFWCNARFGVTIGENTLIGPHVLIQSSNHVIKNIEIEQNANDENSWCKDNILKRVSGKPIIIGNDVWIGAGCIILPGVNISDKCVIGAGCVITEINSKKIEFGDIVVMENKIRKIGNRSER